MKKTININKYILLLSFAFLSLWACSSDPEPEPEPEPQPVGKSLSVDLNKFDFLSASSVATVNVKSTVKSWVINSSDATWVQVSPASGTVGTYPVKITVLENTTTTARTATLTVSSSDAPSVEIAISQAGIVVVESLYPSYNTNPIPADATGMSSSATEIASRMKLGWNIGNTLEAIGGETAWGNPKVTKALIDLVKAKGFNSVRIPCSWNQNMANPATAEIKVEWLNRVKEVVQYCVDNNMYVIINIHWDGGWLEENCTTAKKEVNNAKQKAFWEQIATHFRDFDEHLLFASANEPNVDNASEMAVLKSYHQTFIDAVRSTGGKNATRTLVVQGPSTDIDKTYKLMKTLPTDTVENRMMAEVHFYGPWNFAGLTKDESWGKMFYYWGAGNHSATDIDRNPTYGEEAELDALFKSMKTLYVDKGIPVILGEFGAIRRNNLSGDDLELHLKSRAYYNKYIVQQSKANGLIPFYWDEGSVSDKGFGIFNRSNNTVYDQRVLDALIEGMK